MPRSAPLGHPCDDGNVCIFTDSAQILWTMLILARLRPCGIFSCTQDCHLRGSATSEESSQHETFVSPSSQRIYSSLYHMHGGGPGLGWQRYSEQLESRFVQTIKYQQCREPSIKETCRECNSERILWGKESRPRISGIPSLWIMYVSWFSQIHWFLCKIFRLFAD